MARPAAASALASGHTWGNPALAPPQFSGTLDASARPDVSSLNTAFDTLRSLSAGAPLSVSSAKVDVAGNRSASWVNAR